MSLIGIPSLKNPMIEHCPLAPLTTWKVGGNARYLAEPNTEELPILLDWAKKKGLPVAFIGRGSNLLVADAGFDGLIILTRNTLTNICRDGEFLVAESGASLPALSKAAAREGFAGFEFLIGIPGTVGGGIVMNAGLTVFRPREIAQILVDFDTISLNGDSERLTSEDVKMGYRSSELQDGRRLVTKARFLLSEKGIPEDIRQASLEHHRERKSKQPLDKPTAGSTFKSPPGSKGAGYYIEKAGLKGHQIGGAAVSNKHANWIENTGEASSEDIKTLIKFVRKKVLEEQDILLEAEVKILN